MEDQRRSLNDFPDEILCRILSFFSTEEAATTSVLSKRWRYMWTSLPNLDFKERLHLCYPDDFDIGAERINFIDFVERVLCCRNEPHIKRFLLSCYVNDDAPRIIKWISTAVRRNALEFDISLRSSNNIEFPHCLMNSKTLQILKIYIWYQLQLPQQICLPNLKLLSLRCDSFGDNHELSLILATSSLEELVIDTSNVKNAPAGQLISPPPNKLLPNLKIFKLKGITFIKNYYALNLLFAGSALEELVLEGCKWEGDENVGHLIISAPNLRSVTIDDTHRNDGLASVTISSPLKIFNYKGGLTKDYQLSCSSSMEIFYFLYRCTNSLFDDEDIPHDRFHYILKSLPFVKYLGLLACAVMLPCEARLPVFNNLTSLEIFDGEDYASCLQKVLEYCPCLETLKLPGVLLAVYNINSLLSFNLKCLSSLKNITIKSFKGNTKELGAIQILLSKVTSLETMEIVWLSHTMDSSKREKINTSLFKMPRGSKSCILTIGSGYRYYNY